MTDLATIEKIPRNLDEYIQQRAEQIAAPRIRKAEADTAKATENANQAALSKISTHTRERCLIEALMAAEGKHNEPMTAHQLARALSATVHDAGEGLRELGRVWREAEERSWQRWRVRAMMPTLTMRQVLVHGYVATGEA